MNTSHVVPKIIRSTETISLNYPDKKERPTSVISGKNIALFVETASGNFNKSSDVEVAFVSRTEAIPRPLGTANAVAVNAH